MDNVLHTKFGTAKIRERNLDGEIVEREPTNPLLKDDLLVENAELCHKIDNLELTLTLVCAKEMSAIPTTELLMELGSRLHMFENKAEKYEKLLVKHKKASNLIADLKKENDDLKSTLAYRSNQLVLMEQLIDDLGSEEMDRQMGEILND